MRIPLNGRNAPVPASARLAAVVLAGSMLVSPAWSAEGLPQAAAAHEDQEQRTSSDEEGADLSKVLPVLLTSMERKKLAMEIEAALRHGDMKGAEARLNAAIEMGTLAIVLVDRLRDRDLLDTLQNFGVKGEDAPPVPAEAVAETASPAECPLPLVPASFNGLDMQEALERESRHSNAVVRDLDVLTREYRALQAARDQDASAMEARLASLQTQLRQEQARGADAVRQLAGAQDTLQALQAAREKEATSGSAAMLAMREALAQEKTRADAAARELAGTVEKMTALQQQQQAAASAPLMLRMEAGGLPIAVAAAQGDLSPAAQPPLMTTGAIPVQPAPEPRPQQAAVAAPAAEQPAAAPDRLIVRADELLRKGDVSGARLLLEKSLEAGNPQAAFHLAETFDPQVLSGLGALGLRGDAGRARELYARARALGVARAGERLEALKAQK